jgi:hypothetical protein
MECVTLSSVSVIILTGKNRRIEINSCSSATLYNTTPYGLTWDRTRVSAVTGLQLSLCNPKVYSTVHNNQPSSYLNPVPLVSQMAPSVSILTRVLYKYSISWIVKRGPNYT